MILAAGIAASIEAHARAEAPRECCGLLVGLGDRIDHAVPTRNIAARPTRYEIDPTEHFPVIREARAAGLDVLGAYHSHPTGPPVPSATDLAEAQTEFLYVIAAPAAPGDRAGDRAGDRYELRGYWLDGGNFRPVRLVTE
jgi:proteasome lid subunit RPN8/RPN11